MQPLRRVFRANGLALLVFIGMVRTADGAEPLGSWAIDLSDASEPDQWELAKTTSSELLRWEIVSRGGGPPQKDHALRFLAGSELGVETHLVVLRWFPPEFQPRRESELALEWEWSISDTEISDGVTLGLVVQSADGDTALHCDAVVSHTRFTSGWRVLFTAAGKWVRHRFVYTGSPCHGLADSVRPIGIYLHFINPIRQSLSLGELSVEEWPAGQLPTDPLTQPQRAPPPEEPFRELPVSLLRRVTAGAFEDLDDDGLPELLVLERHGYAHLYRGNLKAPFSEEITEYAGLSGLVTLGTGALFLDLDADHDRDLVITSEFEVPRLFENRGNLRFRERLSLPDRHLSFWYGAAADDIDRDGKTDLFFFSPKEPFFLLLRNRGDWRFEEVDEPFSTVEMVDRGDLTFTAAFADVDVDGWPELFLGREHLLRNQGGELESVRPSWAKPSSDKTEGAVWGDFNGDGDLDLLVLRDTTESGSYPPGRTDAPSETRLLVGDGGGGFRDVTEPAGLPPLVSAEVALAEDFDNDGDLDLYLCQRDRPNHLMLNDGGGRFSDATEGSGFENHGPCDAAVAADVDGDGGVDVLVLGYGSPPRVLFNELSRGGWVGVRLGGKRPATDAIGARVTVLDPVTGRAVGIRWSRRGRGFGSVGPAELRLGTGDLREVDIEVRFASGRIRLVTGVEAGSTLLVRETEPGWRYVVARLAEARFAIIRWSRWSLLSRYWLLWSVAGLGALLGALVLASSKWRTLSGIVLVLVGCASIAIGSVPGRGLNGSPFWLWSVAATAGALSVLAARGTHGLWRRAYSAASVEDLIQLTLDFRHGGVETRGLLAIESRAQNLFQHDRIDPRFRSELLVLAARYAEGTGAQIEKLVGLSKYQFPKLPEASRLGGLSVRLAELCSALPKANENEQALSRYSRELGERAHDARLAVEELLVSLDLRLGSDVQQILREAVQLVAEPIAQERIDVSVKVEPPGILALISRASLLLVIENLFTGSIAAVQAAEERRIEVSGRLEQRRITIRFQDSGPGVTQELRERIFEAGFTTRPSGTGYGLARSREILTTYGGNISLEDSERGASFVIKLHGVRPP